MKAITQYKYGGPETLQFEDIAKPIPQDDEVLVEVRAASLNIADWHMMTGTPWIVRLMGGGFRRPKNTTIGSDVAGVVEAVGTAISTFQPGDEVMGDIRRSFAEYAVAKERWLTHKPEGTSFDQAAGIPLAAITALQGLRDHGKLQAGQKVLVNGASGSVGTFTVQIATAMGAEVTAVCSTRNVDTARSLGATHVIDYTKEDFTKVAERFDVMIDIVGNRSPKACRDLLVAGGIYVIIGGPKGRVLGPIPRMIRAKFAFMGRSQHMVWFVAKVNRPDLDVLSGMVEEGKLVSVVDRTYSLDQVPDAFRYLGEGHAKGKLIVTI